jgi:hypothetical protein
MNRICTLFVCITLLTACSGDSRNKEKDEKTLWEYYLFRMQFYEGSFEDFKEGLKNDRKNANMTPKNIETTVNNSMQILKNFNPEMG